MNLDTIVWPDVILGLLAGLLIGWIIEWIIDRRARKNDLALFEQESQTQRINLEEARDAKARIEADMNALQDAHHEVLSRNDGLDRLTQQLQTRQASLEQETSDLRTKLRKVAGTHQANESLRTQISTAEERIRELEGEREGLTAHVSDMARVQGELEQNRARVEQLELEKQTLRDKLAQTETELATIGSQHAVNAEDMGQMETMRVDLEQAQLEIERLRASQTTSTAESGRIDTMRRDVTEMEERLEAAEEQLLHEQNRVVAAEVKLQNMADKLTDERLRAQSVEQELDQLRDGKAAANAARIRAEMEAQRLEIAELRHKLAAQTSPATESMFVEMERPSDEALARIVTGGEPDKLQMINGIGNVFAKRLNDAGIFTFADMARVTPEKVIEIVKARPWQAADVEMWLEQARQFATSEGVA